MVCIAFAGNLPLHYAAGYADLDVVKELLRVFPDASRVANDHNNLPLHLAASNEAGVEVCRVLIQACPGVHDVAKRVRLEYLSSEYCALLA